MSLARCSSWLKSSLHYTDINSIMQMYAEKLSILTLTTVFIGARAREGGYGAAAPSVAQNNFFQVIGNFFDQQPAAKNEKNKYRVGQKKVSLIIFAITLFTASQFS